MKRAPLVSGRYRLRPYQVDAAERALAHFASHERGQCVAGCGAGKSPLAIYIARSLEAERIAICVPNLQLVDQWLRHVRGEWKDAVVTAVCSDADGVRLRQRYDAEVTTDVGVLRRRLLDATAAGKRHIVVSTYHSAPVLAEAVAPTRMGAFDFLVADEAHRTAGSGAEASFRTVVLPGGAPGALRATRRLFMTATPRDNPGLLEERSRVYSVALSEADAADVGVAALRIQPALDPLVRQARYREGKFLDGQFLPDGSLLAIRPLVPRPYVDAEPHHPHEVVRFKVDPTSGQVNPLDPSLASGVLAPSADDARDLFRALIVACERNAVPMQAPLLDGVRYYEHRSSAPYFMSDRALYGEIVADIPSAVVEDAGFTAPYRIAFVGVRRSEVDALIAAGPTLNGDDPASAAQMYASYLAMTRTATPYALQRAMIFNSSIADADAFAAIGAWGKAEGPAFSVRALHTQLPPAQRDAVLSSFRASSQDAGRRLDVLSVVRMGIEGQDIPETDVICFSAPKTSIIDVVQAKGRAVRIDPKRPDKVATVLVPIIVDDRTGVHHTSASARIDETSRAIARTVLGALMSNDERAPSRVVVDADSAVPAAPRVATARAPALLPNEEIARALRHLEAELAQELIAISPRRYFGVEYDRDAGGFRANLAIYEPKSLTPGPRVVVDALYATARDAAIAVDRAADAHGLTPDEAPRNFGKSFNIFDRRRVANGTGYLPLTGDTGYVAFYLARRAFGVAVRYAATAEDAEAMRVALTARYGDPRQLPATSVRHDLVSLRGDGRDGAEWDPVARRWWAWVHAPTVPPGPAGLQVGLGYFADQASGEHAATIARRVLSVGCFDSAAAAFKGCREALAAAGLTPEPLDAGVPRVAASVPGSSSTPTASVTPSAQLGVA